MASAFKKNQQKSHSRKSHVQISSPTVKRSHNSPVTLQGWLSKRGSDGLQLWKKRWFVLSDYILFYYRDTHEDKLLGSLILASYEISQCSPEEKGYKKFSFKAEHANMRTYYFAAENEALMEQWIKALTLASLLEESEGKACLDTSNGSNIQNESDLASASHDASLLSGPRTPDPQPVYANAPPKPKRLNESSSPECSTDMQFKEDNYQNYSNQSYYLLAQQYHSSPSKQVYSNYERTTPEGFIKSNTIHPIIKQSGRSIPSAQDHCAPPLNTSKGSSQSSKNVSFSFPPRPHSVDFLEYGAKISSSNSAGFDYSEKSHLNVRPKSSLSTVNINDEDTWTAEEYARKMRQSSMYVKPTARRQLPRVPLKQDSMSGNASNSSQQSNFSFEKPVQKNDLGAKGERIPGVVYRAHKMESNDDLKFSRSASARLFRPMTETRTDYNISHMNSPTNFPPENVTLRKDNTNKIQQREEAMKRLLEWKNRMTHSSLRKPHGNSSVNTDRHSSYMMHKKNEYFQTASVSSSGSRNEHTGEHVLNSKDLRRNTEKPPNQSSEDVYNEAGRNIRCLSSPTIPFCQFSSDDDGLYGSESKYGNSVSLVENNNPLRERRQNLDESNARIEPNNTSQKVEPTEPLRNIRIPDGFEFSNEKTYMNLQSDFNVGSKIEPTTNTSPLLINNEDDENNKKLVKSSINVQDYNKKVDKKQQLLSHPVENGKDEEWGVKLDESRVIKEFSYHYITSGKYDECQTRYEKDAFIQSNIKNRNKPSSQEAMNTQENVFSKNNSLLKTTNELHKIPCKESSIHTDGKDTRKESNMFQKISGKTYKKSSRGNIITKGHNSRTYRKDPKLFSKNIVNKSVSLSESSEKRLVQSDSEALLYDTSSDIEDKIVFHRETPEKLELSSDEERDEEVAAVLSKENNFVNTAFDPAMANYRKCFSTDIVERMSVSHSSSPNHSNSQNNSEQNTSFQITHEKNLSTSTDVNSDIQEENYMPMTPRKKSHCSSKNEIVHSRSNSASHTLIIENLLGSSEESPYVEMTQKGSSNVIHTTNNSYHSGSPIVKNEDTYNNSPESARYCEIGKSKEMQYEIIYNSSVAQEPLYMEVPSLKEKDSEKPLLTLINDNESIDFNKSNNSKENINQLKVFSRPSLPDILNTTPSLNQGSGRSDSSDADDEASKDLDSLDAPRHPRFSLSDTFRPASYYLGASLGDRTIITLNTEHPDSSDSDLVSPPPIPTSSPPLDDLETSLDSTIVNKDSPVSNMKTESSNIYSNEIFLHSNVKEFMSPYKLKNSLRNSNSNLYEASSEESVNYEKREQRLKRRPLSADILNSLQDISFIMPQSDGELKENSDQTKLNNSGYDEEQDLPESDHHLNLKLYKSQNSNYNNYYSVNREEVASSNGLDNDSENIRYKDNRFNLQEPIYIDRNVSSPVKIDTKKVIGNQYENLQGDSSSSDYKYFIDKYKCNEASESFKEKYVCVRDNKHTSNEPQNNAPYYYSDLLKIDTKHFHDFDKNRWEEDSVDIEKRAVPNEKNMSKIVSYSQIRENDVPKQRSIFNDSSSLENGNFEPNNIPNISLKSEPSNYASHLNKNENCNTPKNLQKIFSPMQESSEGQTPHRTRSLEGLIDNHSSNTLSNNSDVFNNKAHARLVKSQSQKILPEHNNLCKKIPGNKLNYVANQDIWEEDTLWRESLRKVSIRHTRSLEDLDRKDGAQVVSSPAHISEDSQTYENLNVAYKLAKNGQNYSKENYETFPGSNNQSKFDPKCKCEKGQDNVKNFESSTYNANDINRTNCEQKCIECMRSKEQPDGTNSSFEIDREKLRQWDLMSSAPAMLSSNRAVIKPITERKTNFSSTNLPGVETERKENPEPQKEGQVVEKTPANITPGLLIPQEQDQAQGWNLKVSAGELLGRTHEELVLLLIQLRRQRATVCQSMEKCHREIEAKACLADLDKANKIEHLQKLDELKAKLSDLEKQYEKGKPLVNLVDNMVKLGSLYQAGSPQKLEFIQRIQEQRLLAEEKRDWERLRPDHHELKAKVERLYRLDKLLQEESGTLYNLQLDKGVLEQALGGLRTKLQGIHGNSPETEWYKRQQRLLERELSRVRSILALNSKKLEETVAENARLEQELVVLRQKLQLSRRTAEPGGTNTAALEAELCRVQLLVGNLLRQRQELSLQVRQLTEKSNSLSRQIWPNSPDHLAEGISSSRKQFSNGWIETDLDADVSNDISSSSHSVRHQAAYISPLYVNTADREMLNDCINYEDELFDGSPLSARSPDCSRISECTEEEAFKQSYGLHLKEKPQEIKTVRIVKRESERRQRDRDRSGNIGIPITSTNPKRPIIDDRFGDKTKNERDLEEVVELDYKPNEPPPTPGPRTDSVNAVWNLVRKNKLKGKLVSKNAYEKSDPLVLQTDSPQLSPVYLSETARKIVEEVAWQGMGEKRLVPKEKRRHLTMSGPSLIAPQSFISQMGSRDDLDIERVLRPRLTTPDVVRSTLIRVDPHYTKETIDNILGAPGKILIPERYIPESQPELTKEEQNKRSKKADAIRKMLCETTSVPPKESGLESEGLEKTSSLKKKVAEEKKNREHLLQLSQILAQQVMEKSKLVAGVNPTTME